MTSDDTLLPTALRGSDQLLPTPGAVVLLFCLYLLRGTEERADGPPPRP